MSPNQHPAARQFMHFMCPGCGDADLTTLLNEASLFNSASIQQDQDVRNFIKLSVLHQQLGYVLFGTKPCSYGLVIDEQVALSLTNRTKPTVNELDATLEYVTNRTYSSDLVIRKLKDSTLPSSKLTAVLTLSKSRVLDVVSNNLDLFQEYLGHNCTAESVLERLLQASSIDKIFAPNRFTECEHLFGIILGYGRDNSLAWQQNQKSTRSANRKPDSHIELDSIARSDDSLIAPVMLKHCHTDESIALLQIYEQERLKIQLLLESGELYENSIEALCGKDIKNEQRL